jgi:translation initiation factor IF-2
MSDVTVAQFAEVLKVPVDRLLVQLESAGIEVAGPQALISDEAKLELLTHLRRSHGVAEPAGKAGGVVAAPRKITLARKTQSELKQASAQGRARTVNVEVRHKKTYIKRDVLEEQNKQHLDEAELKRKEIEAAEAAERERQEAARR